MEIQFQLKRKLNLKREKNKMAYGVKSKRGRPKKQIDFFTALTTQGKLKEVGMDKNGNTYRIYEFQGKDFKLILGKK